MSNVHGINEGLISDTKAEILGPPSRYVKSGSSIRLSCRVYFGPDGPDDDYRRSAVMHWFHGQGSTEKRGIQLSENQINQSDGRSV